MSTPSALSFVTVFLIAAASLLSAERLNVREFGTVRDGSANDSPAIQEPLEAASAGMDVVLPSGRYRLEEGLRVPSGVTLIGTWRAPHHAEERKGTILLAVADSGNEEGPALIHLMPNSAVRGITIYYPEQRVPDVIPYPWTIQGEGMHGSIIDVTLVNPYKAINFGQFANELHYVRNVFGSPLKAGIHIDQCTDIGRIENVHFNPTSGRGPARRISPTGQLCESTSSRISSLFPSAAPTGNTCSIPSALAQKSVISAISKTGM